MTGKSRNRLQAAAAVVGSVLAGLVAASLVVYALSARHYGCDDFHNEQPAAPGDVVTFRICPEGQAYIIPFVLIALFVTLTLLGLVAYRRRAGRLEVGRAAGQ